MGWYLQTVKMFEQNVFILSYSQNIFPSIPSENSFLLPVTNEAGTYDFQQNQRLVYDKFPVWRRDLKEKLLALSFILKIFC